ncbi:MAG: hypothetical protein U9R32_02325 [Bacteroidota bacterium]|nr:hypothetical protein [Bacteroidota bacterium]
MSKLLIILILLIFCFTYSFSQEVVKETNNSGEKIIVDGNKFYQHDIRLTLPQLSDIVSVNPDSYKMVKSAKGSASFAGVLGYAGGFLIGWPLGTALGGGEPNWAMAGIGAGLVVIAIPISSGANKKIKEAVALYNDGLKPITYSKPSPSFAIQTTQSGIGLVMKF